YGQSVCHCICNGNGPFEQWPGQPTYLLGGVREENGKVYFTRFGKPPFDHYYHPVGDTLLFDFTLQLGDTINYGGYSLTVTQTGADLEGRKYVRLRTPIDTVWWEPPTVLDWTEGIGFWGLLETIPYLNGVFYENNCFSEDPLDPCPIPCAVTGTTTPELETQVKIYPSFAQETVQVELGAGFSELNLQIYSAQGSLMRSVHQESNTAEINVQNLPVGAYLFAFETSPGVYVSKWYLK
ncbi:MAG: T9SS type A sorting domain-containing protein, partial [Phycisphaerae bacterium]|nr:T9SS type A sorting domain-containing protein [Saprospiraceae bacterium]